MNAPLRDLLDRLAEDQPAVHVAPDTYRLGRRAHRRGTVLRAGAATGLVAVALLAVGPVVDGAVLDGTDRVAGPAAGDGSPAMPAQLYPVPERLASFGEDGYTWHEDVRADDLAIGPTAAVFPVNGGAVMAVSAVDGGYRGLELPGFDDSSSYFSFEGVPVALSPDGTRLAWTWNPDVVSGSGGEPVETGVRVADLTTGEVTDVRIPARYGVYAHGFDWSSDGRFLTYGLDRATDAGGEVRGSRNFGVGLLDTATGMAQSTPLGGAGTSHAVSNDATVAVVGDGYNAIWSREATMSVWTYEGPFTSVDWAPSGDRTALSTQDRALAIGDQRGVRRQLSQSMPGEGRLRVLGWPDESAFVVLDEATSSLTRVSADLEERQPLVGADDVADLYQLSVATDLLDEPTWDAPEPEWPIDVGAVALRSAVAAGALLLGGALVVSLRRRS